MDVDQKLVKAANASRLYILRMSVWQVVVVPSDSVIEVAVKITHESEFEAVSEVQHQCLGIYNFTHVMTFS